MKPGSEKTLPPHAVLLAHGLRYEHPDVPGLSELWGRSALHCPFCDGWEVRDLPVAVLGVPGVYAAGDAATPSVRSVALAIGSGTRVGASLVLDLTAQAAA